MSTGCIEGTYPNKWTGRCDDCSGCSACLPGTEMKGDYCTKCSGTTYL